MWVLPPPLAPDKFHDVAFLTFEQAEKIDSYTVFAQPVSDDDVPDYLAIISTPMALATMRTKLNNGDYGKGTEGAFKLYTGFLLMFDNCCLYNNNGWIIKEGARFMAFSPKIYDSSRKTVVAKEKVKKKSRKKATPRLVVAKEKENKKSKKKAMTTPAATATTTATQTTKALI